MALYDAVIEFPMAPVRLGITLTGDALSGIAFVDDATALRVPLTPLATAVVEQLQTYLRNPSFQFRLPLFARGTVFQKRVWQAMVGIPAGETRTYGDIAQLLNSGPRAVGGASRANPLPVIVPCHRIVGKHGQGGFMGGATNSQAIKAWLLSHEREV